MTLAKPIRIIVGVATFWYALYLLLTVVSIVLFFGYVFLTLLAGGQASSNLGGLFRQILSLEFMLPIHLCSLFLEVGLLIFYLIHTIRNANARDSMRIVLGLAKTAAAIVLLHPGVALLKEWAYAGVAFAWIMAKISAYA